PNFHSPSLILSSFIIINYRLLRIRLGEKPLFEGAFRDAVKSQPPVGTVQIIRQRSINQGQRIPLSVRASALVGSVRWHDPGG
ncbi:MAG: hypothetical protein WBM86_09075, partial [Waterburya sp.]